ncbi:DUF1002 domain-containing protein [Alkalicoccus urumqiensis]|uniref:DUF1002 domain-containing protein n=1 Tax=Alkalicoccus urumqiensis TaxID=1548213 RepID=A0A2P6MFU3_ALKUR|nr:DUF1002 domain-containing protein [Alkalicoccus urumqiensis]PRO65137.1 DUF1002 domain-containing protein [Alkalicoccus urumqiensis]
MWKKGLLTITAVSLLAGVLPQAAGADAAPGDEIVTLGEDLTPAQREDLLEEMDITEAEAAEVVTVTNEEEHQYLGDYIDAGVIGTRALSSSKITMMEEGTGMDVETNRITWVSEGMYANALITAGVEDASVYVTAPFDVSGTGALTGLIKAYEASTDEEIPEEQKQTANEELVRTAELGEKYGVEEATELMARIKEGIAEEDIQTEEDLRALIQRLAEEMGIELTEQELDSLTALFERIRGLNIDWDQVRGQIDSVRDNISGFMESDEGQSIIQSIVDFFQAVLDWITSLFGGTDTESENTARADSRDAGGLKS